MEDEIMVVPVYSKIKEEEIKEIKLDVLENIDDKLNYLIKKLKNKKNCCYEEISKLKSHVTKLIIKISKEEEKNE